MTRDELKIRTQQAIDAIPVLREKEYGWAEIEKMLNEILNELDDTPWHTGTPTEEGWYLIKFFMGKKGEEVVFYRTENYKRSPYCTFDNMEWQKIEDKEDGHTD